MSLKPPFWVELLDKSNAVVSRQRIHTESMTIGRAYDNDLIVDDPFVAPLHLKVGYDTEGVLWIEDLASNSAQGTDQQSPVTRMRVDREAAIRIGETSLRVRTAAFSVPPALSIHDQPRTGSTGPGYGSKAILCAGVFIVVSWVSTWLAQTAEFKLANFLPEGLIFPLVVLAWAGMWALVTRIITTQAQYSRHVFIVFAVLLGLFFLDVVADMLAYSAAWLPPQRWLPVASWALFGALLFAHIAVINPRHTRLTGAVVAVLVVLAIGVHISLRIESDRVQPQRVAAWLLPPYLSLKPPSTPETFFKDVDMLRPKLEEARKKEPTSGGFSFDDFD